MRNLKICVVCDNSLEEFDSSYTRQLLGKGTLLAEKMGGEVVAICIGEYDRDRFGKLLQFGATKIIYCDCREKYTSVYADIIEQIIHKEVPELIMFQASSFSKELAAILSTRLESGLTADCVDILIDDENELIFERAALSDSILAKIKTINCPYSMCTVKKDVFEAQYHECNWEVEQYIQEIKSFPSTKSNHIQIIERKKVRSKQEIDLSKYKILFGMGRGIGDKENIDMLYDVAKRYGAAVVGTRGVVEDGLMEVNRQVGQSGISVDRKSVV